MHNTNIWQIKKGRKLEKVKEIKDNKMTYFNPNCIDK